LQLPLHRLELQYRPVVEEEHVSFPQKHVPAFVEEPLLIGQFTKDTVLVEELHTRPAGAIFVPQPHGATFGTIPLSLIQTATAHDATICSFCHAPFPQAVTGVGEGEESSGVAASTVVDQ
jgi:hypothetical protein